MAKAATVTIIEVLQVYCRDCARYDLEAEKCLDGKVNPPSWEIAVTVSQVLGLRSICVFNDHRERLVRARTPVNQSEARNLWKD
ncbi:MAG: hypothetical protein ACAH95_11210 [Fimbriimonas sp.]